MRSVRAFKLLSRVDSSTIAAYHVRRGEKHKARGSWVKRVKGNQLSNESGRDTFDIASEFTQGNVASQVLLMNPFERTNEVAHIGPPPFGGVAVDFTEAVPIVIARPFMLTMTDAVALTSDAVVALVFIGVDNRLAQGKAVRMGTQGGTLIQHTDRGSQ